MALGVDLFFNALAVCVDNAPDAVCVNVARCLRLIATDFESTATLFRVTACGTANRRVAGTLFMRREW